MAVSYASVSFHCLSPVLTQLFFSKPLTTYLICIRAYLPRSTRKKQERQTFARYARLTPGCNLPRNFITIASIVLEICTGQNLRKKIHK